MPRDTSPLDPQSRSRHAILRWHLPTLFRAHDSDDSEDDRHDFGVQLSSRRKARIDEWDLDAEVCVGALERDRLEQLCRYLLGPPLALDPLRALDDGRIAIESKRPWADRTTHVTMSPSAFIARLASLVPRAFMRAALSPRRARGWRIRRRGPERRDRA